MRFGCFFIVILQFCQNDIHSIKLQIDVNKKAKNVSYS